MAAVNAKIKHLFIAILIKIKERRYREIKYLFKRYNSDTLLIVFSGFSSDGRPSYNYVRTLKNIRINKLFLLDDFCGGGSYYLGQNGDFFLCDRIGELASKITKKYGIKHVFACGSSKGGTSALIHGLINGWKKS